MNLCKLSARLMLAGAVLIPPLSGFAQQVIVLNETLQAGEMVKLRVTTESEFALGRESVSIADNKVTVTLPSYFVQPNPGPLPPNSYSDRPATTGYVILGSLPPGSYLADVLFLDRRTTAVTLVGSAQFNIASNSAASVAALPAHDLFK